MYIFSKAKAFKEQAKRLPLVTLPRSGFVFGIHPNDENQNPLSSTSIFSPRDKVSKEWYVFLLKSVVPSSEKPFSHGLSLKGKTQGPSSLVSAWK